MIENDWDYAERRRYERVSLDSYLRVNDLDQQKLLGHVVDISRDGMRLISDQPITVAQDYNVKLEVSIYGRRFDNIVLVARSVWSQTDDNPSLYDTGFHFEQVSPESDEAIQTLIEELKAA